MPKDAAEALAVSALVWIAGDPDRAGAFLGATGAEPGDLRSRAADPMFLGFVLDFLMQNDDDVIDFAADHSCQPEDILRARAGLPGGDHPHWT